MSRSAHFLDEYRFQIEEMVKLRCTDDHIHKVLHDIQTIQFSKEILVRYMDETGIRKRRTVKGWTPAICPSCGYELSEDLGDGYYRHPTFLERCPNPDCGQRIDW